MIVSSLQMTFTSMRKSFAKLEAEIFQNALKMFPKHIQQVFKTHSMHFQKQKHVQHVFKTH